MIYLERDDALEDALDVINNKRIKDATDKLLEVLKVRKITHDVTSARGVDFLNRLRKLYDKWIELIRRLRIIVEENEKTRKEREQDLLRNRLRRWKR